LIPLPIFHPLLVGLDFSATFATQQDAIGWIAVLIAITLQTSFMTPPFGFALFFLKGAAPPQVTTSDIYRGTVPIVALQVLALSIVFTFPVLTTWLPGAVLG